MLLLRRIQRPSRALVAPSLVRLQRHVLPQQQQLLFAQQQQQRLLWGRASDLMSWMGFKGDDADAKTTNKTSTSTQLPKSKDSHIATAATASDAPIAPPTRSKSSKRKAARAAKAAAEAPASPQLNETAAADVSSSSSSAAPRAPATVSTRCGIQVAVDASSVRDVKRAMLALKRHVSAAARSSEPLAVWDVMHSYAPFTITDDGIARCFDASEAAADESAGSRPQVVQLLPLATSVELLWRVQALAIGAPVSFLGATPEVANVLFVSEKTALRQLLQAVATTKDKPALEAAKALFEQYEMDRAAQVDAIFDAFDTFDSVENPKPTRAQLDDWTRLSRDTYGAYIDVLAALGEHAQVVAFFDSAANRETFLGSPQTLRKALKACLAEHRGDLARCLIDDFERHFPWLVITKNAYQTALQACLRSPEAAKTPAQLANALYVYDRMALDAGYIVYPNMWSMLFNTCVYLARHDDAVRVFESYKRQQIAPFAHRFTQTLRTVCKLEQFDTAVAMVHAWVALERAAFDATSASKTSKSSILDNQHATATQALASKAERECFNKILWEMLKRAPTLEQLAQVLYAMEMRGAPAGAQVIRLLVARYLRDPVVSKSDAANSTDASTPQARIEHLLALWDAVPRVIEHNGFVVHLVLEHCVAAGWERECRFVIDAALAKQIDLPMGSVVKVLEMHEQRGAFDAVADLGTALLRDVSHSERARLPQSFFETLLLSYLRAQEFNRVLGLEKELKLTARFPKSDVLAMVVKDAANA